MDQQNTLTVKIKRFLINIWPTVYRIINGSIYFVFSVIRNGVQTAIRQIKQI